jgi:immune inhibitor A
MRERPLASDAGAGDLSSMPRQARRVRPNEHAATAVLLTAALLLLAPLSARAITPRNPALAEEARKAGVTALPAMPHFPALLAPSREAALRTTGHVDLLVLLIDYADRPSDAIRRPPSFFQSLAFSSTGKSMRTYYDENSYSALDLGGEVEGWLRSALSYRYFVNADLTPGTPDDYGFDTRPEAYNAATDPYPRNVWGIVMEAVTLADAAGVDFSQFDGDGDGVVDALCVVHASGGAEEVFEGAEDFIWSHKSNLADYLASVGEPAFATNDGVTIGDYFVGAESGRLGVYCHEFGHMFGLPDLYRTDQETREQSSIVGSFDLMDYGTWVDGNGLTPSHLGAWSKYELGWINPIAVSLEEGGTSEIENAQLFAAASAITTGAFYRILPNPNGPDWTPRRVGRGEYFLIENRVAGNADFDEFLPASGLAIWHVDEARPNNNSSNANEHLLTIVQADGEDWTAFRGGAAVGEPTDLWPDGRNDPNFTAASEPSSRLHSGAFSGAEIRNIRQLGEVIEADLSASAVRFGAPYAYPNPLKMEEGAEAEITFTYEPSARVDPGDAAPPVLVQIFDLSGTLVRTLRAESGPAIWDCRNDGGKMVASGAYFYRIQSDNETADGKVVILH